MTIVAFLCGALAACATFGTETTALEPQNRSLSAGKGRIYVLRQRMWAGTIVLIPVRVDGTEIGQVASGSHLAADRPPGRHMLSVGNESWPVTHEVEVVAGKTYYFVINSKPVVTTYGAVPIVIPMPSPGKPVGKKNIWSGLYLAELEPSAGEEMLAGLKAGARPPPEAVPDRN
ncbi:hypothetical protein J2S22_002473 [Rhodoplanes tepidamans]|nr:DUF2846 domain-containing protein [Rhodoplanes tepidamans]MDQ0355536.1 hypothetical protein [Rhodoplanes tepidamans]